MLFGKYTFKNTFTTKANLPEYKGSTLRGGLGHALKHVVCTFHNHMTCEQCLLASQCAYVTIFEPDLSGKPFPDLKRISARPSPFVIEPPLTTKTHFSPEESFAFNLLLFGEVNDLLPYFIYAFEKMGQKGIGKNLDGHRGKFQLDEIENRGKILYSPRNQFIQPPEPLESLDLNPVSNESRDISTITITLETPLRFKIDRRISTSLTFDHLIRVSLRRVSFLMACYGKKNITLDFDGLIQRATSIEVTDSQLQWFDWQRYSARQHQEMNMGGLVGSVTYTGVLDDFLPFIKFCEKVHLGKQTAFGLGKIRCIS